MRQDPLVEMDRVLTALQKLVKADAQRGVGDFSNAQWEALTEAKALIDIYRPAP